MQRTKRRTNETNLAGYIFISPWLIGFLLLTLWPMAQSIYLSFTEYSLLDDPVWVGGQNYSNIFFNDDLFYKSLTVTFAFVIISVPLKLFFSLMVAMLLNKNLKGMSLYRTAIYFPSLIGTSVAVAVLWRNMFGSDGYVNHVLSWFGIEGVGWIANPETSLGTLILLTTWQFGSTMVIFLAGLKQIPQDLYESASVDGAGNIKKFFHITLPMLSPVMFFNLVLGVIGSFQMFTQAYSELSNYQELSNYPLTKEKELYEFIRSAEDCIEIEFAVEDFYQYFLQNGLIDKTYIYELTIRLLVGIEKRDQAELEEVSACKNVEIMSIVRME
ncbi:carbohydrate ABC transporter permease [Metabacillus sp. Hm71]|uniref:carbohydrate ABC transporter permease n=1 Tax=Metabacillus sp. Hm71 TaxID=3450743 RepID=UPI003F44057C